MGKVKFLLIVMLFIFGIYIYAVTPSQCWEDFRVRVMWCVDTFPTGSDGEATCLSGALMGYSDCLKHATYPNQSNTLFFSRLLSVNLFRAKGKPEFEDVTFSVETEGDYYINIANGVRTTDDKTQVSSALIKIDGREILSPSDLNKNVLFKVVKIHLTEGKHTLSVQLRSKPQSFLTIVICEKDMTGMMN